MRHKEISCYIVLIIVAIIGIVIGIFVLNHTFERQASKNRFLAPFHEVYDALCEKYPFITSLHKDVGAGGRYGMYYIECDIDENVDCFAEFVNVQRDINALMEAGKSDAWFNEFDGHIEIYTDCRRLRVFYHNGSMSNQVWVDDIISDAYNVLWDVFPGNDDISLVIFLTDYSDEIKSQIMQKYEGRNIIVRRQVGA